MKPNPRQFALVHGGISLLRRTFHGRARGITWLSRGVLKFALAFLFLPLSMSLAASSTPFCTKYHSSLLAKDIAYCIDRTRPNEPAGAGEAVAYFMHGTNGSASSWLSSHYARALQDLRASAQVLPAMTFVSFDTSAYSFFMDDPTGTPYETWFMKEFVPYIEHTYSVCAQKSCRNLIGQSMGGFGALKTAFRYPDLFNAVAVNSPALPPFSIWVKLQTWLSFFSKPHRIGALKGFFLINITRHLMPNEDAYRVQNPIALTENLRLDQVPPLYFDMGGQDKYGFEVGYGIFKQLLDDRGIPYQTHFEPKAGHDMWERHAGDAIQFLIDHTDSLLSGSR